MVPDPVADGRAPVESGESEVQPASISAEFTCNICGVVNARPDEEVTREGGQCRNCKSYSRLRSMVHAVIEEFLPASKALWSAPLTKRVKGLGCSDSQVYAKPLAQVFDYTNTFFDKEPQLDIANVDWSRWGRGTFDFITATDVFEHVAPPVEKAFQGALRLLKPGGILVITVPTTPWNDTIEHFPDLNDWALERDRGGSPVLVDRKPDGDVVRHTDLIFHGGDGMTLEFRRFSRTSLLKALAEAGFEDVTVYDRNIPSKGIVLAPHNLVAVARKRKAAPVTVEDGFGELAEDSPIAGATPLFVLGAPRSGTTLCSDLLNSHPRVLMTNEVRVFSFFAHAVRHIPSGDGGGLQYARSHGAEFAESLRAHIPAIVTSTYDRIAREEGRKDLLFWGDKNPHHADCLDLIHGAYPQAHYVRIRRDPRDVACSIFEMNTSKDLAQACGGVKANILMTREFLQKLPPDTWYDLKYEDLLSDPEGQIQALFSGFLGLPDVEAPRRWMKDQGRFDRHLRFKDATDFAKRSVARWRRELEPDQVEMMNAIFGELLELEGYGA